MSKLDLSSYFPELGGSLRSADLNQAFEDVAKNLGVGIALFQRSHSRYQIYRQATSYESLALDEMFSDLEALQDAINVGAKLLYRSFSSSTGLSSNGVDQILYSDTLHGILHLPLVSRQSFLRDLEDDYGDVIPDPSISVYINDFPASEGDSPRLMLSSKPWDIWFEESTIPGNRIVRIAFPGSPRIAPNYLLLSPFPTYKSIISSVEFKDFGDNYSTPYSGFPSTVNTNSLFYFSNSAFRDEIRFVVTPWNAGNYISGMRRVDIGYAAFSNSGTVRFSLTNGDTIGNIIGVTHDPQNGSFVRPGPDPFGQLDDEPVVLRIFSDVGYSSQIWDNIAYPYPTTASPIVVGASTIYVEVEMNKVSDTTPTLRSMGVLYN